MFKNDSLHDLHFTITQSQHRAFHRFEQAKFAYGGSVLGLSQFTLLPQMPLKMISKLKSILNQLEIIISLHKSKSVTFSVYMWPLQNKTRFKFLNWR